MFEIVLSCMSLRPLVVGRRLVVLAALIQASMVLAAGSLAHAQPAAAPTQLDSGMPWTAEAGTVPHRIQVIVKPNLNAVSVTMPRSKEVALFDAGPLWIKGWEALQRRRFSVAPSDPMDLTLRVEQLQLQCRGNATRVQCSVDYEFALIGPNDAKVWSKRGVATGSQGQMAAAAQPADPAALKDERAATAQAAAAALAAAIVALDTQLVALREVLTLPDLGEIKNTTRMELSRLWKLDVSAILHGKGRDARLIGSSDMTVDEYLKEGACTDELPLPLCVPKALQFGLYNQEELAGWRRDAQREAILEGIPEPPSAPIPVLVHPLGGNLVVRRGVVPQLTELAALDSMVIKLFWHPDSCHVIAVSMLGRFDAKRLGGGRGRAFAVPLAGGPVVELGALDKGLAMEDLQDIQLNGAKLSVAAAGGKSKAFDLGALPAGCKGPALVTVTDPWSVELAGKAYRLNGVVGGQRVLSTVSGHRYGSAPQPVLLALAGESPAVGSTPEAALAHRSLGWARLGFTAEVAKILGFAKEVMDVSQLVASVGAIDGTIKAHQSLIAADIAAGQQADKLRLATEGKEEAARVMVSAETALRKRNWSEAESLAERASELDPSNPRSREVAEIAKNTREAAEAQEQAQRVRKEEQQVLGAVPRMKAQCLSSLDLYHRARQLARQSAAKGQVGQARQAEAAASLAVGRIREAQMRLRAAIAIYRNRGENNAANGVQQEVYQCLRL